MNFDEMINKENQEKEDRMKREFQINTRDITSIGCGSGMGIGCVAQLKKHLPGSEVEIYLHWAFGYRFYSSFVEKGPRYEKSNNYDVKYNGDGKYTVGRSAPTLVSGSTRSFTVFVSGLFDEARITNVDHYRELFNEANKSFSAYKQKCIDCRNNEKYLSDLKAALIKKIGELASDAQRECGFAPVSTLDQVYEDIITTCRTRRYRYIARNDMIHDYFGEPNPRGNPRRDGVRKEEGIPPNLIIALIIVGIFFALVFTLM